MTSHFGDMEQLRASFTRSVFSILPRFRTVQTKCAGTGFVIHVNSEFAIALTAKHVMFDMLKLTPEHNRQQRVSHLGPETYTEGWVSQNPELRFRAGFYIEGRTHVFLVTRAMMSGADTAVIRLVRDGDAALSDLSELNVLNLSLHRFNWGPLLLAGIKFDSTSFAIQPEKTGEWARFRARLMLREGNLVSESEGAQLSSISKGLIFRTTIPFDHGMSGSPVFHAVSHQGRPIPVVCGIVSTDWHSEETETSSPSTGSVCASTFNVLHQQIEHGQTVLDWFRGKKIHGSGVDPNDIWFDGDQIKIGDRPDCDRR